MRLERAHVQIGDEIDDAHRSRHKHNVLLRVVVVLHHLEQRFHDAALDERVATRVVRGQVVEEGEERGGEVVREGLLARVDQVVDALAHERRQQTVVAGRLRGLDDLRQLVGLLQVNDGSEGLERGGLDLGKRGQQRLLWQRGGAGGSGQLGLIGSDNGRGRRGGTGGRAGRRRGRLELLDREHVDELLD